ncbi:MAG: ribonuclease E/G [Sneathiella sp.]|nr:ribonuclease E/G [Sneathiella sp.]
MEGLMEQILLIEEGLFETRAALMQDEKLVELQIERPEDISLIGTFYTGRITKLLPDMDIAFVDLGSGETGFLQARDISAKAGKINATVHEGEKLLVQVIKDKTGDKTVQLGCRFSLASSNLIYRPKSQGVILSKHIQGEAVRANLMAFADGIGDAGGLTIRTSAKIASKDDLEAELQYLLKEWSDISAEYLKSEKPGPLGKVQTPLTRILQGQQLAQGAAIIVNSARVMNEAKNFLQSVSPSALDNLEYWDKQTPLFEASGAEEQLEQARKIRIHLKSGASITFEQTEAMVVIDVNSASLTSSSGTRSVEFMTNLKAVGEICRQIRLRNYSGIIVIDFIQMSGKGDVQNLSRVMQKAFDEDPVPTRLIGMTELGLMQVTRKRVRRSLDELMLTPCSACDGRGAVDGETTVLSNVTRALENEIRFSHGATLVVEAGDLLAKRLESHKNILETHLARPLQIIANRQMSALDYKIG